ncbi:acyl carrier protein [Streptomyces umbrinus]
MTGLGDSIGADTVLTAVLAAAASVFGDAVGAGDGFFSLGGDSLAAVEIVTALEAELDVDISTDVVVCTDTFADLAAALASAMAAETGTPSGELEACALPLSAGDGAREGQR